VLRRAAPRARRAGNGTRTRDPNLGKVVLYQLSYSRARPACSAACATSNRPVTRGGAAQVLPRVSYRAGNGGEGNRTPDLLNAIQALSQLSYAPGRSLVLRSLRHAWCRGQQQPQEPRSLAGGIPCVKRSTLAENARVSILQRPTGSARRCGCRCVVPGLAAWFRVRRTVSWSTRAIARCPVTGVARGRPRARRCGRHGGQHGALRRVLQHTPLHARYASAPRAVLAVRTRARRAASPIGRSAGTSSAHSSARSTASAPPRAAAARHLRS
jgi:hypothetical protein